MSASMAEINQQGLVNQREARFFHENSTKISKICGKTNIVIEETNPRKTRETCAELQNLPNDCIPLLLTLNITPLTIAAVKVGAV